MDTRWKATGWVVLAVMLAGAVWAAGEGMKEGKMHKEFTPTLLNAQTLIGAKVASNQGEDLGRIDDVVLNAGWDDVSYVAVHYGGILGMGGKMFAVPWESLNIHRSAQNRIDKVTLNVAKRDFENTPGFDTSNWPASGNMRWGRMTQPGTMDRPATRDIDRPETAEKHETVMQNGFRLRRVTEIVGSSVKNLQGEDLGDIDDIVLDLREGRPVYAVVAFGGVLGIGEKLASVPWEAVELLPRLATARIDTTRNTLESIAYSADTPPNLASMDEASRLHRRFNVAPYWETYGYLEPGFEEQTFDAWKKDSPFNRSFDAGNIVTKSGTITSVGSFTPAAGNPQGLRLRLRTNEGETLTVYGGPRNFSSDKGFDFYYGDKVEITGSKTTVNGRSVLMATEIKRDNKTLELRNKEGKPQWSDDDLRKYYYRPSERFERERER